MEGDIQSPHRLHCLPYSRLHLKSDTSPLYFTNRHILLRPTTSTDENNEHNNKTKIFITRAKANTLHCYIDIIQKQTISEMRWANSSLTLRLIAYSVFKRVSEKTLCAAKTLSSSRVPQLG